MKVAYFSKYSDQGPSSRFRIFQFQELFQQAGTQLQVQVLFNDDYFDVLRMPASLSRDFWKTVYVAKRFWQRLKDLKENDADLFVIEHQLFPYLPFLIEKRLLPKRYLVEFDDAIYLTHPRKIPDIIRSAAGVIVGNKFLAGYAKRFHQNVHIVPSVLDTDRFRPSRRSQDGKVTIGWSGLEYNFKYLRIIAAVLARLQEKYPLEIVILSGSPPQNLSFAYRFEKWDRNHETEQINRFDIGIMPLEMDEWCRAKCGMKLLQYMSLEIPSVVTAVGVNAEIIRHGENGLLAVTMEEWEHRLSELIESAGLRKSIGEAARQTVVEHYSIHRWFPQILEIYKRYAH